MTVRAVVGQARRVSTTSQATSSVVRELLRLLAVGCAMGLGVPGWELVRTWNLREIVGHVPELEALALLLVVAVVAARAVPGLRWGAAVAGVVGVAVASAGAFAAADWLPLAWHTLTGHRVAGSTSLLPALVITLVAVPVAAVLLRASTGGALLPGQPVASVAPVVSRVVATGAASLVGVALFVAADLLVSELVGAHPPASYVTEEVRLTAVTLVVGLAVLLAVARPGRLRRSDGVVLLAAGLVAYPLSTLAYVPVRGAWPSGLWPGLIALALLLGGALSLWATGSGPREPRVDPVVGR